MRWAVAVVALVLIGVAVLSPRRVDIMGHDVPRPSAQKIEHASSKQYICVGGGKVMRGDNWAVTTTSAWTNTSSTTQQPFCAISPAQ